VDKYSAAHCNVVYFHLIVIVSGYFGYVGYHQFYLGVLGLHVVAYGFKHIMVARRRLYSGRC
jgi:hypothetical protein